MTTDASDHHEPSALREVGGEDFAEAVLASPVPVLALFWTTWSPLDRQMRQVVGRLAAREGVRIVAVNVDDNPDLAAAYRLEYVPTCIIFEDGRETVRLAGARPEAELHEVLDRLAGG